QVEGRRDAGRGGPARVARDRVQGRTIERGRQQQSRSRKCLRHFNKRSVIAWLSVAAATISGAAPSSVPTMTGGGVTERTITLPASALPHQRAMSSRSRAPAGRSESLGRPRNATPPIRSPVTL